MQVLGALGLKKLGLLCCVLERVVGGLCFSLPGLTGYRRTQCQCFQQLLPRQFPSASLPPSDGVEVLSSLPEILLAASSWSWVWEASDSSAYDQPLCRNHCWSDPCMLWCLLLIALTASLLGQVQADGCFQPRGKNEVQRLGRWISG